MKQWLKQLALALYPRPWGLRHLGRGSVVMWPRRVQGAPHVEIGTDVIVQPHGWIAAFDGYGAQRFTPRIRIGDHSRLGRHVIITAIEAVTIGEGCLFSEQVFVTDHAHQAIPGPVPPTRQPLVAHGPVQIGRHCFVGMRASIMGGVTLGDHCVVGAHAVVTRSFPAGSVIAGAPARLLRTLPLPDNSAASDGPHTAHV